MEIMPPDTGNKDPQTGTLIRLRGLYPSLKTALRKVADVILRQPEMAIYASVNEVAAVATVSEATVMRFCRILGFKGFQDFKIALAREMVIPSTRFHEEVGGEGEDDTTVVRKIFRTNAVALEDTLEILEIEAMKEAAQLLLTARQILVVGVGGSGPAVTYTGNRFLLLGLKAFMCTDFYLMLMAASLLSRGDVVLAISNLGTTREIVETVGIAREKQARIMCITNNSLSPLARVCSPVLVTASREVTLPEEAVASLVCQIAILDALFALIAAAQGGAVPGDPEQHGSSAGQSGSDAQTRQIALPAPGTLSMSGALSLRRGLRINHAHPAAVERGHCAHLPDAAPEKLPGGHRRQCQRAPGRPGAHHPQRD